MEPEKAVGGHLHDRLVALLGIIGGISVELVDDRLGFLRRYVVVGLLPGEYCAQVGFDEDFLRLALCRAIREGKRLARHVRIAFGFEQLNDDGFELGFGEFHERGLVSAISMLSKYVTISLTVSRENSALFSSS